MKPYEKIFPLLLSFVSFFIALARRGWRTVLIASTDVDHKQGLTELFCSSTLMSYINELVRTQNQHFSP